MPSCRSDQRDEGRGVFFQTEYCIRPDSGSGTKLWIEDSGRWFAGPDGKPARAHGTVRVINERHETRTAGSATSPATTGSPAN